MPLVEFHGLPPVAGPGALPQVPSVGLTGLLAARASNHLPAALEGDLAALRACGYEADRLLKAEKIRRRV